MQLSIRTILLTLIISVNPWHGNCSISLNSGKNQTKRQASGQENFIFNAQRNRVEGEWHKLIKFLFSAERLGLDQKLF